MKSLLNSMKYAAIVLGVGLAIQANVCLGDATINLYGQNLQDANGGPLNGLVILVASRSNANFSLPTTTNLISGDDYELARFDAAEGVVAGVVNNLSVDGSTGVNNPDPVAIYWFPTLTTGSPTNIPGGTPYGMFTNAGGLAAGDGSGR